jgi:hypothetical protein
MCGFRHPDLLSSFVNRDVEILSKQERIRPLKALQIAFGHKSVCVLHGHRNLRHNPVIYLAKESFVNLLTSDDEEVAGKIRL